MTIFISILGFICIIFGAFAKSIIINYIFFFLAGFFYSGIFPNILAISSIYYRESKNVILSFIITAASVGSLIAPQIVGAFYKFSNFYNAFIILGSVIFILSLLIMLFYLKMKKYERNVKK